MKRMQWGLFLILALVGGFILMELFLWAMQMWPVPKAPNMPDLQNFITSILTFLALASAVATIYWFHKIHLAPIQIVIEPFRQALPKDINIDDYQLKGVTMEARERIAEDLKRIGERVRQIMKERGPDLYHAPFSSPLFSHRMPELVETEGGHLQEATENIPNQVGLTVPLSKRLFPRSSIKVTCTLVERGTAVEKGKSGEMGVSFEIMNTAGNAMPAIGTIFSNSIKDSRPANPEAAVDRYKAMLPDVSHILAIEICKAQMLIHLQPWWYRMWRKKRCDAQIYNFIGFLYTFRAKEGVKEENGKTLGMQKLWRKVLEHPENPQVAMRSILSRVYEKVYEKISQSLLQLLPEDGKDTSDKDLSKEEISGLRDNEFYRRAIDNLQTAIRTDESWYVPYTNLALIHSVRSQQIEQVVRNLLPAKQLQPGVSPSQNGAQAAAGQGKDRAAPGLKQSPGRENVKEKALLNALNLQYAARNEYRQALSRVEYPLLEDDEDCNEKRKIKIDLARTKLLIGRLLNLAKEECLYTKIGNCTDPDKLIQKTREELKQIQRDIEKKQSAEDEQHLYKINVLADVQIPYDLACCHAIAYGLDISHPQYLSKAKEDYQCAYEYLALSLARNVYILARHKIPGNDEGAQEDYEVAIDIEAMRDTIARDPSLAMVHKAESVSELEPIRTAEDPTIININTVEDPNWYYWSRVDNDLDFKDIRDNCKGMQPALLKRTLLHMLLEKPDIFIKTGKYFEKEIIDNMLKNIIEYNKDRSSL